MTNFSSGPGETCANMTISHNTRTDTRPYEDAYKITISNTSAMDAFSQRGNLNIVSHHNGLVKLLAQDLPQRHILHAEIGRVEDDSPLTVYLPGSPYTNRG